MTFMSRTISSDVLIVGAGPAGSAAAWYAAQAGYHVGVVDMANHLTTPRDKTCGDGLTPRAVAALHHMGAQGILNDRPHINGLKLHGFGGSVTEPWPSTGSFPTRGSAIARTELDSALLRHAVAAGAQFHGGIKILDATHDRANRVSAVTGVDQATGEQVTCHFKFLLLAEGVRSTVARKLGVQWLRGMVHGVAARSYITTPHGDEPWIHSHLELRDEAHVAQPGYGWVFPLGGTQANLGCGALATAKRPSGVNTKKLLRHYAEQLREEWAIEGAPARVTSALLPMGGAVTRVAGENWATIGDTAALVNPLNGEGIDYALESARLVVSLLPDAPRNPHGLLFMWPAVLREEYGEAFSLARRLAMGLTMPGLMSALGPVGMRGPQAHAVMAVATRVMGNLVSPRDRDVTSRVWRAVGALSVGADKLLAQDARPLFGRSIAL
ncbi:geranylgeranyl reductase family protein [Corynebacterium sp. HMSC28B08]|uniref:geranylgeranyl reductase family protein n=1 Tax=Corynebacterium sp. HMSC28B08 TaxID=1581066 RepID=UPI0008A35D19|nr:geranylgeranyl reductase family protein [Corynebacterium sp. HMSC28B08]OFT88838.1 FAD-linked oxidoreductase [Corynebacterium sp. HMSC28B08]